MAPWSRRRQPNALLASAHRASLDRNSADAPREYANWQDEGWGMYGDDDTGNGLGEYRQGVTWLGNVISRARLIPAMAPRNPGDEPTPIDPDTNDPAVALVRSIAGGIGGQSELLRSGAIHLTVPGEGWFVGEVPVDDPELRRDISWKFLSKDEVRRDRGGGTGLQIRTDATHWINLPDDALPVRVWRPHERYHWKADSSTRAALPIMRRLQLLNRKVDAQIQSRLASNGIIWIPEEMDFPVKEAYKDADDPFIAELIDLSSIAIATPGSALAALPIYVRAKGDMIAQVARTTFADILDPSLREDREFEIRRLSTAMDVPPEILLGMAGVNHWQAWQVEESALKTTVTSLLELICWAMTTGWLNPALAAMRNGPTDQDADVDWSAERIVWYDLSELAVRPDRSADAITMHGDLTITDAAEMRETGFDETDLLTDPDELRRRIGLKIVSNPQASTLAIGLELLGIDTVAKVEIQQGDPAETPVDVLEPVNPGDLPRDDQPRAAPSTNGDAPPGLERVTVPG